MRRNRTRLVRVLRVRRRRVVAWADRRVGDWLPFIPSWGLSVLLHALVILMLALILFVRGDRNPGESIRGEFATQLTEDLTSLSPADRAGDPFAADKADEPPSLSIEPPAADESRINQPELSGVTRFKPDLAGPEMTRSSELVPQTEIAKNSPFRLLARDANDRNMALLPLNLASENMTAPFSGRQEAVRAKLVRREGGTVHSEKSVEAGLDWLVRHQKVDGGWSLNYHGQCQGRCPPENCLESDTAATGLALLPLLGAGHTHTAKSRYQFNVRKALDWIVSHQQPDGDLYVGGMRMSHFYSHAIATMALCESYGLSKDPALRGPAQLAVDFIIGAQHPSGGWRYFPGQAGDTSVFGWQMFALRSARLAGLHVPKSVAQGSRAYLDSASADGRKVTYAYLPGMGASPVMTAEALLSRQYLGWPRDYPPLIKGAAMVAKDLEASGERNIYYWYYATQLLHNMQNKDWEEWNVRVRDGLVKMQTGGDGCDRGSWDPNSPQPDRWASSSGREGAGRLFLTSLSVLTLEVYYRYLPLYQPSDKDRQKLNNDDDPKKDANEAAPAVAKP